MEHKFINQIEAGQQLNDVYMVKDPILRSTSRGDLYIAMFLCDKTGQLNGRMWQASELIYRDLPKPGFVHIKGRSELYQDNLQIIVNTVTPIDPEKVNIDDFLARTEKDIDQMFAEVTEMASRVKNPQLKAIVDEFLADKELMAKFCKAPGGVKLHHSTIGGLLEHTHNMLRVATTILPFYPKVQADLVLAGIFLHDMGKTEELGYDMAFTYTDTGQLIGHIVGTHLMINRKADALRAKGTQIDQEVLDSLCHIALTHHGQYEFGSPKLPATPEAFMVCMIDDLDAKVDQVTNAIEEEMGDGNWTAWRNALQTRLYRKRIE
ncbi:MAG: 3'-5' exoribonuclease YhaM family protein [Planctomycetota bacterium]|jgi:3'-5' exoribonuclease